MALIWLSGCASGPPPLEASKTPIELERFMGDWYVLASIPITIPFFSEEGAHNAVETYALNADGEIETTYRFRQGAFDGELKVFRPTGFVHDAQTNTEWRMQFVWPFKAAYLIVYCDPEYRHTIIGVPNRKYVWIMSREPTIDESDYEQLLSVVVEAGYDMGAIVRIPHRWPEPEDQTGG